MTPAQAATLRRLAALGFVPAAFALYASAVGIRRGAFAALLDPAGGSLRPLGGPCYVLEGNLSACVESGGQHWFVWKSKRVEATAELLAERKRFADDLASALK